MANLTQSKTEAGQFRWNTGGWFGGAIGSTAWLLPCGGICFLDGDLFVATLVWGCFVLANVVAIFLWMQRDQLALFPALMKLMAVLAIVIPTAWIAIRFWASPQALEKMGMPPGLAVDVLVVMAVPAVACFLYMRKSQMEKLDVNQPLAKEEH